MGASTITTRNTRRAARPTCFRRILKDNIYHHVQELAVRAHAALGCRGVSRVRLPLRRSTRWHRRPRRPGGEHAARHDRDVPGPRDGGRRRVLVWWAGTMDGGGRLLRSMSEAGAHLGLPAGGLRPHRQPRSRSWPGPARNPPPPRQIPAAPSAVAAPRRSAPCRAARSSAPRWSSALMAVTGLRGGARRRPMAAYVATNGAPADIVAKALGFSIDAVTISGLKSLTPDEILRDGGVGAAQLPGPARRERTPRPAEGRAARAGRFERPQALPERPAHHRHGARRRGGLAEGRRSSA